MNRKGISSIVIILIIVGGLVVAVGGFRYYQKQMAKVSKLTGCDIIINGKEACDGNKEPTDETAGWQTYRNEKYGFELKYPPTWQISIWNDEGFSGEGFSLSPIGETDNRYQLIIQIGDRPIDSPNSKADELTSIRFNFSKQLNFRTVSDIDGNIIGYAFTDESPASQFEQALLVGENVVVSISYDVNGNFRDDRVAYNKYLEIFNKLLSTVKFTR